MMERLEKLKASNGQEAPAVMKNDVEEGGEVSHERKQRVRDVKREAEGAREWQMDLYRAHLCTCVRGYSCTCAVMLCRLITRAHDRVNVCVCVCVCARARARVCMCRRPSDATRERFGSTAAE
jgi:hypothetical protein